MPHRDTIVVGASAGGVEALQTLLRGLPRDLGAAVLVVLHIPPSGVNALAAILSRNTELSVTSAEAGQPLTPGSVIVAAPDHHLIVHDGLALTTRGPRENGHRPAVDVLFRSAARALGPRVIGVVLSGSLDDGSAGMIAIQARGGIGVVQNPTDAAHAGMPNSAIAAAAPEHVLAVAAMPELLTRLVGVEVGPPGDDEEDVPPCEPAELSCPDCRGALSSVGETRFQQFRCHFGHAWSPQSLLAESDTALEGALWMALRSLEEKACLSQRMADQIRGGGHTLSAERFDEQSGESREAAALLRQMLVDGTGIIRARDTTTSAQEADESSEGMEKLA